MSLWDNFGGHSRIYYPQLICTFACPPSESVFNGFHRLGKCCYLQQMVSRACLDGAGTFEIVYVTGSCGDGNLMKYNETA